MSKQFLVSTIIPVYNAENYLTDSIECIVNQTIGFSNVQLILIDDGSTDGSANICRQFVARYPENITFLQQVNSGVSSARNAGIAHIAGKYVHFFDSDDIISKDAYLRMVRFLEHNDAHVDFVAIKIKFFDSLIDSHPLNYKFTKNKVIDTIVEPNAPIMHASSCLIKSDVAKQHRFDEKLRITEDSKFISEILHHKKAYGIISKPTLNYRKRSDGSSAIDGKYARKDFYQETITRAYEFMANQWSTGDGHIEKYMQYTLLYDISYRLNQESQSILTPSELSEYKQSLKALVCRLDDDVIIQYHHLEFYKKAFLLKWKYGGDFASHIHQKNGSYLFDSLPLLDRLQAESHIDFINELDDSLIFEGYINHDPIVDTDSYSITIGSIVAPVTFVPRQQREKSFLGEVLYTGAAFTATVPRKGLYGSIYVSTGPSFTFNNFTVGQFTNLSGVGGVYTRRGSLLIKKVSTRLYVQKNNLLRRILYNCIFTLGLLTYWSMPKVREQLGKYRGRNLTMLSSKAKVFELIKPFLFMAETIAYLPRAVILRLAYHFAKLFIDKPIWIISDRGMAAGDNGEALFRYIATQSNCPANVYFAVSKNSKDFMRLQQYGNVVDQSGIKYKLLFLLSDAVISSHADIETTNPFIRQIDQYVDLFKFKFVFLQHGVTKDDVSSWLNRFEKNIKLFITSGNVEYQSILDGPYYYTGKEVALIGMPRFDLLESKPAGKIILAPTYRKQLALEKTDKNGKRAYDESFKESEYFNFYNNLMNDSQLLATLKEANLVGKFYIHPNLESQRQDFSANDTFTIMDYPYDYKRAFKEGNLLISDHSSVVFDFAYLKKPVIYAHFDIEKLFAGHSYKQGAFFSDEKNGFGPVYKDYKSLVQGIIVAVKSDCKMPDEYKERVSHFFRYVDKNNSARAYDLLREL